MSDDELETILQRQLHEERASPHSLDEVVKAIKQTSSEKSYNIDVIPAEMFNHGGIHLTKKLTQLFSGIRKKCVVPEDFQDASIVHLYKRKGNRTIYDNHRGIYILSVAGKILECVLNRILKKTDMSVYAESKCGFRPRFGTVDMIFSMRQIQEKCREQNMDVYMVFIELTKSFDTINRSSI